MNASQRASLPLQVRRDLGHQVFKSAALAVFANGVHFPLVIVAIELGHDLCVVLALHRQVVARHLLLAAAIQNAAKSIFYLASLGR